MFLNLGREIRISMSVLSGVDNEIKFFGLLILAPLIITMLSFVVGNWLYFIVFLAIGILAFLGHQMVQQRGGWGIDDQIP